MKTLPPRLGRGIKGFMGEAKRKPKCCAVTKEWGDRCSRYARIGQFCRYHFAEATTNAP
jgi:hypothetical protein